MTLDAFKTNGSSPPELSDLEVAVLESVEVYVAHRNVNAQYAVEAGRLLLQLKEKVGEHGAWLPTLERLGVEVRVAQRCMRLALKYVGTTHLPKTVTEAEAVVAVPDYHHRHHAENRRKVRAVDPELADRVDAGEVSLREAMAQTKAARIAAGRTSKLGNPSIRPQALDTRSDDEREADKPVDLNPEKLQLVTLVSEAHSHIGNNYQADYILKSYRTMLDYRTKRLSRRPIPPEFFEQNEEFKKVRAFGEQVAKFHAELFGPS